MTWRSPLPRLTWSALARRRYPGWRAHLARIRRLARLTPDAFRAWQDRRVASHLQWARRAVPSFRDRIRPGMRLQDLPVLTRRDVQLGEEVLRDRTRPPRRLRRETSGGSTGEPVVVWRDDAHHAWDLATEVHVLEGWGLLPWCRSAFLWGADQDLGDLGLRARLTLRLQDRLLFNAFRMGDAELAATAARLTGFRPEYVQGYASALALFADWLRRNAPGHAIRPRVIRSTAEALDERTRALVERTFRAPVRDFYGSRECGSLAWECRARGLHVVGHGHVVELVDADGAPVPPGVAGRVLVTSLTNRAFGLLRYETGDVAAWADDAPCACGLPFPRLLRIHGRTSDFLTTPAGERIHGEWFTHLFYGRAGVDRFQVHQPDLGHVWVRTVGSAGEGDLRDLLAAIRTRMGPDVEVRWEGVADIGPTASGKYRFTVSDVPWRGPDGG